MCMNNFTFTSELLVCWEHLHGKHDFRGWLWAVSLEAPTTTSTWQCGIQRAWCSGMSEVTFSLTHFLCQGLFACFCPYRGEATLVQVKFIHRCDNNLNASQCQRHLLRGPRSIGASSSRPGCHLPASSWLCSCTHVRGELQCIEPQQSIIKSCYQIYTLSPVPTKIFQRQLEINQ